MVGRRDSAAEDAMASPRTCAGLFLLTLATLMFEILLTRIFSVTMWYHYGFMAISMALFGMTVGAVIVYLRPARFPQGRTKRALALSALGFSIAMVMSVVAHLTIPFGFAFVHYVVGTYLVISVPFVLSGIGVSLALTRFPSQISTLYAVDLAGAACGCLLVIWTLNMTDGPTAVIVTALLASAGAAIFAADARATTLARTAIVTTILLGLFAGTNAVMAHRQSPILRLAWIRGRAAAHPLYEKWNSFSRIAVRGDPNTPSTPLTWGLSTTYPQDRKIKQVQITIDANAGTVITAFDGHMDGLDYLAYDVTNVVHYLKRGATVLVVGAGGGRDILSAFAFGQRSVVAVEINRDIIGTLNGPFGDFSGHLDRDPRVRFVNDEARSYIARTPDQFDIIQLSLVDTAAATAAGAFVLTENSLYTTEAWTLLLRRLSADGVLSVSRWYIGQRPGEMYKVTALASTALKNLGIEDPWRHILVVRRLKGIDPRYGPFGTATILVSPAPFSAGDLATIEGVARRMRFDVIVSPRGAIDTTFARLASGLDLGAFARTYPLKIAPPTDDSPFFFDMVRLRDAFRISPWGLGTEIFTAVPVRALVVLLLVVIALTLTCIIVPIGLTERRETLRSSLPLFAYFASIGIGFMMVEISQMQRLIIFLGHPTYGLSVVLFALLVSSGLGSLMTRTNGPGVAPGAARLGALLVALVAFGTVTPHAIAAFGGATTTIRILAAVSVLFPLGLFMGMAFPLGMQLAAAHFGSVTPWFWGVNGATSVCASVLAVAVAMSAGISASFWAGVGCYVVALAAWSRAARSGQPNQRTAPGRAFFSRASIASDTPGE